MAIQITAAFLLGALIHICLYYRQKIAATGFAARMSPAAFVLMAGSSIALSGVFAYYLGPDNLLLSAGLAGTFILVFLHPVAAVCFLVTVLMLRPWEVLPEETFLLPLVPRACAALTLASWLMHSLKADRLGLLWNRGCTLFFCFIGWLVLAACFSPGPFDALDFVFTSFFPIIVLALLIQNACLERADLDALRGAVSIAVAGVISTALYLTYTNPTPTIDNRLAGPGIFGNANDLGSLIALAAPLAFFHFLRSKGKRRFAIGAFLLTIYLVGLWKSQSRGAMLAIAACVMAYFLWCRERRNKGLGKLLIAMAVPLLLFVNIKRGSEDMEGSSTSRWNYAIAGFRMARTHPLFGVGLNNYPVQYENYTSVFLEWGNRTAHSSWVLALAETGFIGLFLFVSFFFSAARTSWVYRKERPEFFLSIVSYGICMSFLSHTYVFVPYMLCFLAISSSRVEKKAASAGTAKKLKAAACLVIALAPLRVSAAEGFSLSATPGLDKPIGSYAPKYSSRLALKGSRGETLSFIMNASGTGCASLKPLRFEGLEDAEQPRFALSELLTIRIENPSYPRAPVGEIPDPLVPWPVEKEICLESKPRLFVGEIAIPAGAPPGVVRALLGQGAGALDIELEIWKMSMPAQPALPAYMSISTYGLLLGHYGKWHEGEGDLARAYRESLEQHLVAAFGTFVTDAPVKNEGGKLTLDFKDKPSPDQSFSYVNIDGRPSGEYFEVPRIKIDDADKPATLEYLTALENTLPSLNRPGKALMYLWDEPRKEDMPDVKRLATLVKKLAPSVKVMVTMPWAEGFDKVIDVFCPVMDHFGFDGHPGPDKYAELKKSGHELWLYASCMSHGCEALIDSGAPDFVIDRPAAYIRSIPWISARFGADAFLYYNVNYAYQFYPAKDPWKDQWYFSGNGDGTIFYPGRPGMHGLTSHQPLPSLRLKAWREASFDAEYIKWAVQKDARPAWLSGAMHELVENPKVWNREYSAYQKLRDRIGSYLNSK